MLILDIDTRKKMQKVWLWMNRTFADPSHFSWFSGNQSFEVDRRADSLLGSSVFWLLIQKIINHRIYPLSPNVWLKATMKIINQLMGLAAEIFMVNLASGTFNSQWRRSCPECLRALRPEFLQRCDKKGQKEGLNQQPAKKGWLNQEDYSWLKLTIKRIGIWRWRSHFLQTWILLRHKAREISGAKQRPHREICDNLYTYMQMCIYIYTYIYIYCIYMYIYIYV